MIRKRTIRLAPFALAALAALALASAAPARGTTTITISHHMRGCHVWSVKLRPAAAEPLGCDRARLDAQVRQ